MKLVRLCEYIHICLLHQISLTSIVQVFSFQQLKTECGGHGTEYCIVNEVDVELQKLITRNRQLKEVDLEGSKSISISKGENMRFHF